MSDGVDRVLGVGAMGDVDHPEKRVTVAEQEAMISEGSPVAAAAEVPPAAPEPPADPPADHDEDHPDA